MTIDVYDWLHRTGANPPDDSDDPDYQACSEDLGGAVGEPRPTLYEGVFAHEYQHLLEYYEDFDEVTWVNEGLSDWAGGATGYFHPGIDVAVATADYRHTATLKSGRTDVTRVFWTARHVRGA